MKDLKKEKKLEQFHPRDKTNPRPDTRQAELKSLRSLRYLGGEQRFWWTLGFDKLVTRVIISRETTQRIQAEYVTSKLVEEEK